MSDGCIPALPEGLPSAAGIRSFVCGHGTLHLILLDKDEKPIAIAVMHPEVGASLLDEMHSQMSAWAEGEMARRATTGDVGHG